MKQYGRTYLIENTESAPKTIALEPVSLLKSKTGERHLYDEKWLQELIAKHPDILPIDEIEPALDGSVSVCTEMKVSGKYVDNLFVTGRGDLIIIECKLWRNPEARREVVGQIMEYAARLSHWDFEKLDDAVKLTTPTDGFSKGEGLYERISNRLKEDVLPEAAFVDAVSRNLKRGRFLLLVVGDGIREDIESMAEFLQQHAGLHFTFALAEISIIPLPDGQFIVQPRVLARTVQIPRSVFTYSENQPTNIKDAIKVSSTEQIMPLTLSEEYLINSLNTKEPGMGDGLKKFIAELEPLGIQTELTRTAIILSGVSGDEDRRLGTIDCKTGILWLDVVVSRAQKSGFRDLALKYYRSIVGLIDDPKEKERIGVAEAKHEIAAPRLKFLLLKPAQWRDAINDYLRAIAEIS